MTVACVQYAFIKARLLRPEKRKMAILNDVSSVITPGRTTLLLGPPAAGKSTLLKALAGKLGHEGGLKVSCQMLYTSTQLLSPVEAACSRMGYFSTLQQPYPSSASKSAIQTCHCNFEVTLCVGHLSKF